MAFQLPKGFNPLFFTVDEAERLFGPPEEFVEASRRTEQPMFIITTAYLTLMINGCTDQATALMAAFKATYPSDADWNLFDKVLVDILAVAADRGDRWEVEVMELAKSAFWAEITVLHLGSFTSRDPRMFDGIFYGETSGLVQIFELGPEFIPLLRQTGQRDALFLGVAAHMELRIHGGEDALADAILARAKIEWPEEDWAVHQTVMDKAYAIAMRKGRQWRRRVFDTVHQHFISPASRLPDSFVPYFFDSMFYEFVFSGRRLAITTCYEHNNLGAAVKILVGLHLNGQSGLVAELTAVVRELWPADRLERLDEMLQTAVESRDGAKPHWLDLLGMAIEMLFNPPTGPLAMAA